MTTSASGLSKKLQNCDLFGSSVNLNYNGEEQYGTTGGGLVSMLIKSTTLAFFCMRLISVFGYQDPTISSYHMFEDRSLMEESLNLADYSYNFYFYFQGKDTQPVPLDPSIGKFRI